MTIDMIRIKLFGQIGYVVRKIENNEVVGVVGSFDNKADALKAKAEAEAAQAAA
jgi:hypothetical protein